MQICDYKYYNICGYIWNYLIAHTIILYNTKYLYT